MVAWFEYDRLGVVDLLVADARETDLVDLVKMEVERTVEVKVDQEERMAIEGRRIEAKIVDVTDQSPGPRVRNSRIL